MISLEERNKKIIEAIVAKADIVCPGALAMIGIYGSFITGDIHEKSDLDLLVLLNDDSGFRLSCTFIQDDLQVGHDLYCTTWESLQSDARYEHPNISKLMDSHIVYCADEKYKEDLEGLRNQVKRILSLPLSQEDYLKAEKLLKEAEHYYTMAMISEGKTDVLAWAGYVVHYVENALAMLNKKYFHYGTKRIYEELEAMENRPENIVELIEAVTSTTSPSLIKEYLKSLIKETIEFFEKVRESFQQSKRTVSESTIRGTYEEMFSNWRNKMYLAAETDNKHLAFMSMISLHAMLQDIKSEVDIAEYDVLSRYNPQNLYETAKAYDDILNQYLQEYIKCKIQVKHFADIDAFVRDYEKTGKF